MPARGLNAFFGFTDGGKNHVNMHFYYSYFASKFNCLEETDAKKLFLSLAHQYHPDKGGDTEAMKALNGAYKQYLKTHRTGTVKDNQDEIDEDLINKINELVKYNDLEIEILGCWIWVTGNTKERKEELKQLNFLFSPKKTAWYYRKEENKKGRYNSDFSLDEIREKYGSKFAKKSLKLSNSH